MKYQTLKLLASSPLIVGFSPPPTNNYRLHHVHDKCNVHGFVVATSTEGIIQTCPAAVPGTQSSSSSLFALKFRTGALFAKPKARLDADDDDEEDLDYAEDDEEDEEEDDYGEDVEIGNDDEEEEEDEIMMEYNDEDEEYEEEYYDDDEQGDATQASSEEDEYEEEEEEADDTAVAMGDSLPDVWSSYDAAYEDPPTPLLESDDSDPLYVQAKESVLSQISDRKELAEREKLIPRNIETVEDMQKMINYFQNEMTEEEKMEIMKDPDVMEAERMVKENKLQISEEDLEEFMIQDEDGNLILDPEAKGDDEVPFSEMHGFDAFPSVYDTENGGDLIYPPNKAFTEKDLVEMDDLLRKYRESRAKLENQTFFGEEHTMAYMDVERDWPRLSNETQNEILDVIENSNTMACPEPEMWLMYDLNFNVTNLILASFKHNIEAPIIFTQWMPQLEVYERYADQRKKEFAWTWDDVEAADMDELERYYRGIGYDAIPKKEPHETGIITLDESDLDDEEREMLALENWYDEVYNEESDNLLFDDENFEPKHNVFDPEYGTSSSDKSTTVEDKFMKEYEAFEREFADESQDWRDQFATVERFEIIEDPEGQAAFRGHLVIACAPLDEDLELAEKITERFGEEFGKAVFVETRVLGHARKEDNVYEIWLESYDIDLLHSNAFINSKLWTGPSEVDDAQLDYLVEKVRDLISDESRYSYRMSDFADIKI
eukprot:CCRYP_020183-RB/>CCRYP_020183-RB protein AED:0.09 eAED:0.09 QI:209/0.75/0.6/1/0.5/0.8/5/0/717